MHKSSTNLMRLLRGEKTFTPPFWEVWFRMEEFCRRHYGDYWTKVENRIHMAEDLDMAAVLLAEVETNVWFMVDQKSIDGTTHYAGGALKDIRQFEDRPLPNWENSIRQWKRDQELIKEAGRVSWIILPWCFHAVSISMGLEAFALKVYDDFAFVDRAFEIVEERNRAAIEQIVKEVRPDIVLFDGDCAYKNGLMVHPDLFRKLVFSRTQKTVAPLKNLGIPYTFHTDGRLDAVLPTLVELDFSAVHGCEKAANDLHHLVDAFGKDIVLVGNMDVVFLSKASPEEVYHETTEMLKIGSEKGKFVAACNTSPHDYIPEDNYHAMAKAIADYAAR